MNQDIPFGLTEIKQARERLENVAYKTPVLYSTELNEKLNTKIYLKCENLQRGGAFKFRGAYNRLSQLTEDEKQQGIVAFSSGNHGKAVALASNLLNVKAVVVMPTDTPKTKLQAVKHYGAEVITYDRLKDDREAIARQLSEERNLVLVPPYDDYKIMAGHGTLIIELLDQVPDVDAIVVPIGGGGLISGCSVAAKALKNDIKVYGVEPKGAEDTKQSLAVGKITPIKPPNTIADGIRTLEPGRLTFPIMQQMVEDVLVVSDQQIIEAMKWLYQEVKLVVEPTGAVPAAAALSGLIPNGVKSAAMIISGGNVDPDHFCELIS